MLRYQHTLAALREALNGSSDPFSIRLSIRVENGRGEGSRPRLVVHHEEDPIGEVQSRHVPWLLPLLGYGLTVHVLSVTGDDSRTLGLNVAFGHVAEAVRRAEAEAQGENSTPQRDRPLAA